MRRSVLVVVGVTAFALVLPVGPASAAPKSKFERAQPQAPFPLPACGTTVTISEVANKVRERVTTTADGQTVINIRGHYVLRVTAEDGRTATINASGPADYTFSADGRRSLLQFKGQTVLFPFPDGSAEAAAQKAAGLPAFALTSGPIEIVDVLNPETGQVLTEEFTQTPGHVVDVCSLLE
jgi:hypothetical protein